MRRSLTIAGLLAAAPLLGATPALSFQDTPLAPPAAEVQEAPRAKTQPMPPPMQLGSPAEALQPEDENKGLFGFGLLPKLNPFQKLNFGLDVLYGDKEQQTELPQQGSKADESGDVSVVGKVKRRF